MLSPLLIVVVLTLVVLASIPTRRLSAAGVRPSWLLGYLVVVVVLGLAVYLGAPARFAVPVIAVLYVAPLVAPPDLMGRLLRRDAGSAPRLPAAPRHGEPAEPPPGSSRPGRWFSPRGRGRSAPRPVGSGTGRTVRPDGTLEPDEPDVERR